MNVEQTFVGGVAILIGLFTMLAAALNWEWYYRRRKAQRMEGLIGRRGTRVLHLIIGLALIALGVAISQGFVLNKAVSLRAMTTPLAWRG